MKGLEVFHVPDDFSILGTNDSNNTYDSSSVTANRDGSIIERTEFIIDALQGTQFRTERSASGTVEENGIQQFTISLYDLDLGAIASANINITGITSVMSKSTGGGAFSAVGITQPTFTKANGTVSCSYQFLAAEWVVGDIYRLVVEGITATVDTETVYCPTMVWSNAVLEAANIDTNVETILAELAGAAGIASFPGAANIGDGVSLAEAIRAILTSIVGGDDFDNYTNISNSANASLNAVAQKFAATVGIDGTNTFSTAIHGDAQTTIEAALSAIATYMVAAGGDFSKKVNNLTLRTNFEDIIQDICAVIGVDGTNAWSTSISAGTQTTIEATEQAIGTEVEKLYSVALGTSPVSGSFASFVATGGTALGTALPASTSLYDTTKNLSTVGVTGAPTANTLADTLHKDGLFTYDNTTDSLEALSDKIGAFSGDGGAAQDDSAKASLDLLHTSLATFTFGLGAEYDGSPDVYDTIVTGYDSTGTSANEDGSVLERLEHIQEAVNNGTGSSVPANKSLYDIIGAAYVDAGGGIGTDSVLTDLGLINTAVAAVNTDLGNYSGQTNLQSLLAALGIPDTAGKPLYTCLITDRLDNATYGLAALETLVDDLETEVAKIPKSDAAVTWNATALGSINAEVDTALNTIVPASPTAGSLNDILSKAAGANTFDKATDSLEMLSDKFGAFTGDGGAAQDDSVKASLDLAHTDLDTLITNTTATVAGKLQMAVTTESLDQAASSYDLFTGTAQTVILEKLNVKLPTGAAGGAITSISVQTDDATPGVIINSTMGAVANLTSEADLAWTGTLVINVGTKIQLTINGGAHGSAYTVTVIAQSRAVVSGGSLA